MSPHSILPTQGGGDEVLDILHDNGNRGRGAMLDGSGDTEDEKMIKSAEERE